jgi:lipid-A-disaccharide synthase-like uncharacterized protein
LPVLAIAYVSFFAKGKVDLILSNTDLTNPIIFMGAIGQLMLNFRFIYQWYHSEKNKDSILPLGFWVISSFASVMILTYATYRIDPVLLVAQSMGIVVYLRNIFIFFKAKRAVAD